MVLVHPIGYLVSDALFGLPVVSAMQAKITQETLGKVVETGKRWFIWDNGLVGFGIEVSAKCKSSYVFETRIK